MAEQRSSDFDEWEVEQWTDDTIPENFIVDGVLDSVFKQTVEYTDRNTGKPAEFDKAVWVFKITHCDDFVNPDGEKISGEEQVGRKIRKECDPRVTMHPDNQMRHIMEMLMGQSLEAGMRVSPDDLVGLPCKLTIFHEEYERDGERRVAMKVDEVLPGSRRGDDVPF